MVEFVSLEHYLVVEQHDVLAAQPTSDLFRSLAILFAVAHFELYCDLQGLLGAVITPDYAVLGVDALEFPSVSLHFVDLASSYRI